MADELLKTVQEIQTSNRFILKRLNGLFNSSDGHCFCSRKQEQNEKDIRKLETKINELERVVEEKDKAQSELEKQFKHLKEKVDSLELSVMAVQTDDSKLRSASLRKERAVLKHQELLTEVVKQKSATSDIAKPAPERRETVSQMSQTEKCETSDSPSELTDSSEARSSPSVTSQVKAQPTEKRNEDTFITKKYTIRRSSDKSASVLKGKESETLESSAKHSGSDKAHKEKEAPKSGQSAHQEENPKKPVEVINQPIRKTHGTEQFWRFIAQQELEAGKRTLKDLEGVHTVICLDISASMVEQDAWKEASTFLQDYLNGLEDIASLHGITNEHVALVTFGHETSVQKRFTNNYCEIRQLIERQKLGGPSPLYGGLVLGLAAAGSSERNVYFKFMLNIFEVLNSVQVFTKVIILTDGLLTEVGQYAGPDFPDENLDETKAKLVQCMDEYKNSHLDTYCVPVGKYHKKDSRGERLRLIYSITENASPCTQTKTNLKFDDNHLSFLRDYTQYLKYEVLGSKPGNEDAREFLDLMLEIADGRKLDFRSGRQFARRTYLTTKITDPLGILSFSLGGSDFLDFSAEDKAMIEEIKSDARKNLFSRLGGDGKPKKYREMDGGNFPPIGSRVRRGPDWRWNNQDSNGPGTVIGHDDGEQVWVEWDEDDHQNVYRYGQPGLDVLIVDEPRKLKFGQNIAVGCVVKPGKDWNQSTSKGQYWQKGVVIKLDQNTANVRWENGERGDYSYGSTGKCEIEVCTGFLAFGSEGHVLGSGITTAPTEKKTKNKNKNVH